MASELRPNIHMEVNFLSLLAVLSMFPLTIDRGSDQQLIRVRASR